MVNLIFVFLLTLSNPQCTGFNSFCNSFEDLKRPLILYDSLEFNTWDSNRLISLDFVDKFKLIDIKNLKYGIKEIKKFKCTSIGKFQFDGFIVLLYKYFSSEAGSGDPFVKLAVFNNAGVKVDDKIILWLDAEDYLYSQRVTCRLLTDKIQILSLTKEKEEINNKIILKKVTKKKWEYVLDKKGKINLINPS